MTPSLRGPVVCLLGMHRSGTSLLARMANLLGVELGPPAELLEAGPDNPKGYWEHRDVVAVNERLLDRLGGTWHTPPDFPPGWVDDPGLDDLRDEARRLAERMASRYPVWGFKDPRTCLTLPLWRSLCPDMVCVLCVRGPLEVAGSLARRDGFSLARGARLWLDHVAAALEHSAGLRSLLVFHDDLLTDPAAELSRLASFLGVTDVAAHVRQLVRTLVRPELRHHHATLADTLGHPDLPFAAAALHAALRLHGPGPVSEVLTVLARQARRPPTPAAEPASELRGQMAALTRKTQTAEEDAARRRAELEEARLRLASSEQYARVLHVQLARQQRRLDELARCEAVRHSTSYRLAERLLRWSRWLLPPGSLRRRCLSLLRPGRVSPVPSPDSPASQPTAVRRGLELAALDGPGPAFLLIAGRDGPARTLSEHLEAEGVRSLVLGPADGGLVRLERFARPDTPELFFDPRTEPTFLTEALRRLGVAHIDHHLPALPPEVQVPRLADELGVAYDCTAHDYFAACPRRNLQDGAGRYCGEPDADGCNDCLARNGDATSRHSAVEITGWRHGCGRLLRGARRVFVPTSDAAIRLARYFPDLTFTVRPCSDAYPSVVRDYYGLRSLGGPVVHRTYRTYGTYEPPNHRTT